ncbi:unnamed protein product, partial [Rhizoctonia solani]
YVRVVISPRVAGVFQPEVNSWPKEQPQKYGCEVDAPSPADRKVKPLCVLKVIRLNPEILKDNYGPKASSPPHPVSLLSAKLSRIRVRDTRYNCGKTLRVNSGPKSIGGSLLRISMLFVFSTLTRGWISKLSILLVEAPPSICLNTRTTQSRSEERWKVIYVLLWIVK